MNSTNDSQSTTESLWFYANSENQPIGPISFAELQRLAAGGVVQPETFIVEQSSQNWRTYAEALASVAPPRTPLPIPGTHATSGRASCKLLTPARAAAMAALLLVGTIGTFIALRAKNSIVGPDGLTMDRKMWRLIKSGSEVYADKQAFEDFHRYSNDKRKTAIVRMKYEDRAFKIAFPKKAQLLESIDSNGLERVRFFSASEQRTYDVLISNADLQPYSEAIEAQANTDHESEIREAINDRQRDREILGKTLAISTDALAFTNTDGFWKFLELAETNKDTPTPEAAAQIARETGQIDIGPNSLGKVVSIDAPYNWVQLESHRDGKSIHLWVNRQDLHEVTDSSPALPQSNPDTRSDEYWDNFVRMNRDKMPPEQWQKIQALHDAGVSKTNARQAIAKSLGATRIYMDGIRALVHAIGTGEIPMNDARRFLICRHAGLDTFTVTSVTDKYAFYRLQNSDDDETVQIAVEREPETFYGNGTTLKTDMYQLTGTGRFSTVLGAETELLILKGINHK